MSNPSHLSGLNTAQIDAVLHINGPILVVAGAGSGKTKVLTHRVSHLISTGVRPEKILAITFTNKAANEMKERIAKLVQNVQPPRPHDSNASPWVGTFHSLGAWILRREAGRKAAPREAAALGFKKNFSIIDEEDALSLIKESIKELEIDPKQFQPSKIRKIISGKKCDLANADDFLSEDENYFSKKLASIWSLYEQKLKSSNSLDFDDLLVKTVVLFSSHPEILAKYQSLWQYILIDEYQDTDHVQSRLSQQLAALHKNICVVGDLDQSIYGFRGADFRNILEFEATYPETKIVTLEENYRSTEQILEAANAVIAKNKERLPKNLFTRKKGGEKLEIYAAETENDEAYFVAAESQSLIAGGAKPEEIAVLFRTNSQSRVLEEKFLEYTLPHYVVGVKFYNRKEIKDILAYIRASLNSNDLLSKKRIINQPARGIGKVTLAKYFAAVGLKSGEAEKISIFEKTLNKIKSAAENLPASRAVAATLKESGYLDLFESAGTEEGVMRLANIKELVSLAVRFDKIKPPDGLMNMLEEASLMSDQDAIGSRKDGIPLTTVHAAKGLEFDYVFISGLEDGLFPHTTIASEDEKLRLEEERRLFYVALTRARKKVFLSMAFFRTIFGEKQANMPSRFLSDIPPELMENADEEKIIEI
ncbi:MAG: UvrD-helicase domain-containing protein [Candidatus Niyogibacteria bacterium]|nr:MAG: UvrD-helicase domain-containing protein [Candidatus Niyogibacteria bacterium]